MTGSRLLRSPPHLLVAAACAGIALAVAWRPQGVALLALVAITAGAAAGTAGPAKHAVLAATFALGGLWWGGVRLDALDRSPLRAELDRAGVAGVVVTGAARGSGFGLRVPVDVVRFAGTSLREPALLELPLGRSPPQGGFNWSSQHLVMEVVRDGCSRASAGDSCDAWPDVVAGSTLNCAAGGSAAVLA